LEYLKIFIAKICEEICTHYKTRYAYRLWNAVRASSLYFTGTKSFVSERRDVCVKINCDVAYFELPVQESHKEKRTSSQIRHVSVIGVSAKSINV